MGGGWLGGWVGGWGEIEIKAKLSPAEAGVWAELGNKGKMSYSLMLDNSSIKCNMTIYS